MREGKNFQRETGRDRSSESYSKKAAGKGGEKTIEGRKARGRKEMYYYCFAFVALFTEPAFFVHSSAGERERERE